MELRELRGLTVAFLDSPAFPYVFGEAFRPIIQEWTRQLVTDVDLPEGERRGLVIAMKELYEGFCSCYDNCDLDQPEWLHKEFNRGYISE
jgi:hypothetical protein